MLNDERLRELADELADRLGIGDTLPILDALRLAAVEAAAAERAQHDGNLVERLVTECAQLDMMRQALTAEADDLRAKLAAAEAAVDVLDRALVATRTERDAANARAERLREALMALSTDAAQDALEDPIGAAERLPFVRIHEAALSKLRAALEDSRG